MTFLNYSGYYSALPNTKVTKLCDQFIILLCKIVVKTDSIYLDTLAGNPLY